MADKLRYVIEHFQEVKANLQHETADDNVGRMADWLAGESTVSSPNSMLAVR